MSTGDATAQKKAANAKIDLALASWPQSEASSGLSSEVVEVIVRRAQRPGDATANDSVASAPFPESATPVTRVRRRPAGLTESTDFAPGSDHDATGRLSDTGKTPSPPAASLTRVVAPPSSGRVSYPSAPASAEHISAPRTEFAARSSSVPPPPPVAFSSAHPVGSVPAPLASGVHPLGAPAYSSTATPAPWTAYEQLAQRAGTSDQPQVPTQRLSMPTLPPIPSVPNAPVSGRSLPAGAIFSTVPPAKASGSPWLLVVGAFVGAMGCAGAWFALRPPAADSVVVRSGPSAGQSVKRAAAAEAPPQTAERPRGVDPSALPMVQAAASRSTPVRLGPAVPSHLPSAAHAPSDNSPPATAAATDEQAPTTASAPEEPTAPAAREPAVKELAARKEAAAPPAEPSLNDLMKQAVISAPIEAPQKAAEKPTEEPSEPAPAPSPDGVPARPSFGAVQSALRKVLPAARGCLQAGEGVTYATVNFGPTGEVQSVDLKGAAAGAPAEPCVRDALRTARVQPFSDAVFGAPVTVRPL